MSNKDILRVLRLAAVCLGLGLVLGGLAACKQAETPVAATSAPAAAQPCDRTCLEGYVDKFLEAAIAHDPGRVPFTTDVKYTENGVKLDVGDGMWRTLTAKGSYRMFVTDVAARRVAFLGTIREDDIPAVIAVHLKIGDNLRVPEAEVFVQRNEKSAEGFDKIGYTWTETVPEAERMSRADLLKVSTCISPACSATTARATIPSRPTATASRTA